MLAAFLLISRCGITPTVGLRGGAMHRLADQIRAAGRLRPAGRPLSRPAPRGRALDDEPVRPLDRTGRLLPVIRLAVRLG